MENDFLLFVHPNQPAIVGGLIASLLGICGLIGFALMFDAIRDQRAKNKRVMFRLMMIFGVILFFIPMYNWYGYYRVIRIEAKKHVGKFIGADGRDVLELQDGGKWTAIGPQFECEKGTWEFVMNEDFNYIDLESEESGNCSSRIFSNGMQLTISQSRQQLNRIK